MMLSAMATPLASDRPEGALKLHRGATFDVVSIAPLRPQLPTNPPIAGNGMALAINYLTLGVATHLTVSTGRGGVRNRADRKSHALSAVHVGNLTAAASYADAIGLPLTRMISIHWEAAGVPLAGMAKATGHFTDLMTKALARHGSGTAWLWAHENGDGKGGYCHLLAHVPATLVRVVTRLQLGWLRRISGNPYRARVIHSDPIGGRLGLEKSNPSLLAVNLDAALSYILKGAGAAAGAQFNLGRLEPGGHIIGKRCGTSQNIGAKARNDGAA